MGYNEVSISNSPWIMEGYIELILILFRGWPIDDRSFIVRIRVNRKSYLFAKSNE